MRESFRNEKVHKKNQLDVVRCVQTLRNDKVHTKSDNVGKSTRSNTQKVLHLAHVINYNITICAIDMRA